MSAPIPARAAAWMVSRLEQATQIGGCGFCSGLGTTLRTGMEKNLPLKPGYGLIAIMLAVCSTASAHIAFFWSGSMPKPSSSTREADSPVPQSTRPSEIRSSVAMRSATRAGWL